jgi:serine/threonine-protein kinase
LKAQLHEVWAATVAREKSFRPVRAEKAFRSAVDRDNTDMAGEPLQPVAALITPARWEQIKGLFNATLEHEPAQRQAFLAHACADDGPLRNEVESLLWSHEQAEDFIELPAADVAAALLAGDQQRLRPGEMVGHFRIVAVLATGGMGEVYLAEDTRLGRKVALKRLPAQFTLDAERVDRFEQEARAASALNHPNIVTIHEIGHSDSLHYIATEFIDGKTLREHMASTRMNLAEVLDISCQVASALAAAHAAGIMHRDIKPENIMIRPDGYVKVLDFGLAKLVERENTSILGLADSDARQTAKGLILGTVNYMSPEQAKGERVDERTDVFSFGVVIYELLAGRIPFAADSISETFANLINAEPPPLAQFDSNIPDEVQRLVSKTLAKNKDARYQTVNAVLKDLRDLQDHLRHADSLVRSALPASHATDFLRAATGRAQPQTVETQYSWSQQLKQHKRLVASALVGLLIGAIGLGYYFFSARKVALGTAGEKSIAVLPFVNVGGDPDTEYLSEGITASIISSLSRLPNLKVNSFNAVLRYKGQQVDPKTVGREQNVGAVLLGRMIQQGDDVTISAELVDVSDNRRLWGEQYNRKRSDILVVQEEIARQITEGLRLRLTGEEKKQLAKQYTQNNEAYLHYSLGNYYFRKNTKEGFEKSIEAFEQAIKIDPNYALAYAGIAGSYQFMGTRGFAHPKEYEQKVEWAALKALQLDETLAEAHVFLGVHKWGYFDWAGAEKEIKRALELDPNSSQANDAYWVYLSAVGRPDEGLPYELRSRELDAAPDRGQAAFAYFLARQYDKAIELYGNNLAKKPDNAHAHMLLGEAYVAKGMPAEGVAEMENGVALDATLARTPERWDRYPLLAYAYAAAGRGDAALKILVEQQRLAKQRYVSPYNFAIIYTGLGDKDQAFEWLTKSVEQHTLILVHLKCRPLFDPLRSDPRYAELLRRMNLEL